VLSPCSDGNHEEHVHVDLAERHGGYETCEWQVREPVKLAKTTAPQEGEPQAAEQAAALPLPRRRPVAVERRTAAFQENAVAARAAALNWDFGVMARDRRPKSRVKLLADHYIGSLDDSPRRIAFLQREIGYRLVGDRRRDDDALTNLNTHVRSGGTLRHVHDFAF
jgi:hypothetical protein